MVKKVKVTMIIILVIARQLLKTALGKEIESSGRQYGWVWSEAMTDLDNGVSRTYCGNTAGY